MGRGRSQSSAESILYGPFRRKPPSAEIDFHLRLKAFLDDSYYAYRQLNAPYSGTRTWIVRNSILPSDWKDCNRLTYSQANNYQSAYRNFLELEQGAGTWLIDNPKASVNVSFSNKHDHSVDLNFADTKLVFSNNDINDQDQFYDLQQKELKVKLREKLVIEQLCSTPGRWKYFGMPLTNRVEPIIVYLSDDPHLSTQLVLGVVRCYSSTKA